MYDAGFWVVIVAAIAAGAVGTILFWVTSLTAGQRAAGQVALGVAILAIIAGGAMMVGKEWTLKAAPIVALLSLLIGFGIAVRGTEISLRIFGMLLFGASLTYGAIYIASADVLAEINRELKRPYAPQLPKASLIRWPAGSRIVTFPEPQLEGQVWVVIEDETDPKKRVFLTGKTYKVPGTTDTIRAYLHGSDKVTSLPVEIRQEL